MHRLWLVVCLVGAVGCKKSKQAQCDELAQMTIVIADELSKQLGGKSKKSFGSDPELEKKLVEFKAECMKWPDEVFECIRENDDTSPKCVEALAVMEGVVATDLAKAPNGPPIVASADLRIPDDEWDGLGVELDNDGTLFATNEAWVTAVDATGTERWRTPLDNQGWLLAVDGSLLVGGSSTPELVSLDRKTGAVRWRVAIPIVDDGSEYDERRPEAAARFGSKAIVVLSDGRFLRVDPAACATKQQKGCLQVAFAIPDETLHEPQLVERGGYLALGHGERVRVFDETGTLLATIHARDTLGGLAFASPTRLAVTMDDELVLFDIERCRSKPVVLPRKQGRLYVKGDGECDDCVHPAANCVVARSELSDVESDPPVVLADGSMMVMNLDGPARAAVNGNKHWNTRVEAVGPIRKIDGAVVFVSPGRGDQKAKLVALDVQTGKARWVRALDIASRDISYVSDPLVETKGSWLVAGAKGRLSWIKLPTKT